MNLNNKIFLNKGLYDNKNIYENTTDSIIQSLYTNKGLYLTVRETKDHKLIIYEDNDLSRLHNVKDKLYDITYEDLSYLSIYHIPTLKEALNIINGKVDIILNLKIKSNNKEIFNILDNYKGNFLLLGYPRIMYKINKERENYIVGETITHKNKVSIFSLIIKPNFKSIDINYYDKFKINEYKDKNIPLIGYLINNQDRYNKYKDVFNYLIVDNYNNIKFDKK